MAIIINIPERVCSHCNGTVWYVKKVLKKDKICTTHYCNNKRITTEKKRAILNRDKTNAYFRKYYEDNRETCIKYIRKFQQKNVDKIRTYVRKKRADLADYIVRQDIVKEISRDLGSRVIKSDDIPQELVDIKRKQILLRRQIFQSCLQ